ncbi:MAG: NADH-quinone oxidoreductase subunit NuoH [Deltaproteobacteria bacterium]|nr:NADH-quinone oxidoreductase subunit NuoH [Deltaproteobacteria bacterium]
MSGAVDVLLITVKLLVVLVALLLGAAYAVYGERKLLARLQVRLGPNRAGPFGLLQPIADLVKMVCKEDTTPEGAVPLLFRVAPAVVAATALLAFAVVPFGRTLSVAGRRLPLVIAELNVGVLYVIALSSLSVYGIVLGGWSSSSKYSLLGGLRGAAQMISYELALGLSLVPVIMLARSANLSAIVDAQARVPFVLLQPVSFVLYVVAATAEIKRIPFDLPEAENELNAGYHTEYSGLRFGLFFMGEYVNLIVLGGLAAAFFLGGWRGPWLPPFVWFGLKVFAAFFLMVWARATLPRLRYDQLMAFGWKLLIPVALLNVLATGAGLLLWGRP